MTRRRTAVATTIVVVVLVIAIMVGTVTLVIFSPQKLTTTNSTTSASGLELTESISASWVTSGQTLNVSISILNTLPTVNAILPSSDWSFQGVPVALWGGCVGAYPVEVAVLNGDYSAQQLPFVANSTFQYMCAGFVDVDQVIFQPASDQANIIGTGPGAGVNETLGPLHLAFSFITSGYWNLKSLSMELDPPIIGAEGRAPASTAFVPGTYTIAVEDEWGQAVVLHVMIVTRGA